MLLKQDTDKKKSATGQTREKPTIWNPDRVKLGKGASDLPRQGFIQVTAQLAHPEEPRWTAAPGEAAEHNLSTASSHTTWITRLDFQIQNIHEKLPPWIPQRS